MKRLKNPSQRNSQSPSEEITGKSRTSNSKKNDKSTQKQGKGRKNGKTSGQKGNTKGRYVSKADRNAKGRKNVR